MNDMYLIPANTKRGRLIFGLFRTVDLIIFGSGVGLSLILLMAIGTSNFGAVITVLIPGLVCSFLVAPVPNYHNILVLIMDIYAFFTGRQKFVWKGWCFTNGESIDK